MCLRQFKNLKRHPGKRLFVICSLFHQDSSSSSDSSSSDSEDEKKKKKKKTFIIAITLVRIRLLILKHQLIRSRSAVSGVPPFKLNILCSSSNQESSSSSSASEDEKKKKKKDKKKKKKKVSWKKMNFLLQIFTISLFPGFILLVFLLWQWGGKEEERQKEKEEKGQEEGRWSFDQEVDVLVLRVERLFSTFPSFL